MSSFFKKSKKRFTVVLIILVVLGLFASPVAAESNGLQIKLNLQILPEYDNSKVLAIWDGSIINTSGSSFSGLVSFNIPKDVEINMACEIVNGGGHSCQPYKLEDKGDYQVISWRTTRPIAPGAEYPFWLEYYYNPLKGYPDKTMTVDYKPFYNTQIFNLTVKEPFNTTNFKLDPASSTKSTDSEGFNNYSYTFEKLEADKPIQIKVSYTRSEQNSSVQPPPKPSSNQQGTPPSPSEGKPFFSSLGGLLLVGMGIILGVVGVVYFTDSSKRRSNAQRVNQRKSIR